MTKLRHHFRRLIVPTVCIIGIATTIGFAALKQQAVTVSAQSPINVAAASQGATVRTYDDPSNPAFVPSCRANFPASAVINGDRKGLNYGSGGVFQTCDDQYYSGPGYSFIYTGPLIIDFNQLRTINKVDVFTAQDNLMSPADPTPSMTFATEGTPDFMVAYWDLNAMNWQNIYPATDWQNDYHVWKSGSFANITTNKIRISFYMDRVPPSHKIRLTEVEAWQANTDHGDFGTFYSVNQQTIVGNGQPTTASYMFFPNYPNGSGGTAGYAPTQGEYYPLIYTFNGIPAGVTMSYPGYSMYAGVDGCLHDDNIYSPPCVSNGSGQRKYQGYGFALYGNTVPGTYYFTLTATEQLPGGVSRQPYTHTYTFRLDVVGASITANGADTATSIPSGSSATIAWTSFTDPDPAGYTSGVVPSCDVAPTGWAGLSGSQSSGPLTTPTTYSVTCGTSWANLSDSVTVNMAVVPPPTVTAQCSQTSNGVFASSSSPGAGVTCNLSANNQQGFIKWTSTDATSCTESYNGIDGDHLSSTSSSPNPGSAIATVALTNPPANYIFTINCTGPSGSSSDTATFTVPAGGTYFLKQSTKHAVAVNQPGLSVNQLTPLNTNPCDGQGRVVDPSYNFKEGDVVTFAINICNTGTADLIFNGSGDSSHEIVLTDVLGNLTKPSTGWNAQVSCGSDCYIPAGILGVDETSQPGKVIFHVQAKPGGPTNRLVASGGLWTLFFNTTVRAPVGATQSYYYFTNCVADTTTAAMTVSNAPSSNDIYHNPNSSGDNDVPGFCLQSLFSRGSNPPDRQEIAP